MIEIDGFKIDCEVMIDIKKSSNVTSEPVEDRENSSDHVILLPYTATLQGIVTDNPDREMQLFRPEGSSPTDDVYAKLNELWKSKKLFTVTSLSYPPMVDVVLKSFRAPRTAETGDSYQFTAVFQHIVYSDVRAVDGITLVELPRHKRKSRRGSRASVNVEPPDTSTSNATSSGKPKVRRSLLLGIGESDEAGEATSWVADKLVHY